MWWWVKAIGMWMIVDGFADMLYHIDKEDFPTKMFLIRVARMLAGLILACT